MRCVTFYSQIAALSVEEPHYVISISEPGHPVKFSHAHKDILRLYFHDIEDYIAGHVLFSARDARNILKWIKTVPENETIIVHCHAGVSRSAAVAKYLNEHERFFLLMDWPCSGNLSGYSGHVYGMLRRMSLELQNPLQLEDERAAIRNEW